MFNQSSDKECVSHEKPCSQALRQCPALINVLFKKKLFTFFFSYKNSDYMTDMRCLLSPPADRNNKSHIAYILTQLNSLGHG